MANDSFKPAWWLSNRHVQTLYPALFRKVKPLLFYQRERIVTPDNDFLDIDWCDKESNKPLLILLHGLTGSSHSAYIIGLQQSCLKQGWKSAALNFRGCSGEANNLARGYHSGDTDDINFLYQCLRQREPETPIAVVGFSLGGNVLLKWLGEQGSSLSIAAAVAVSVPLQLDICATKLDQGISKIYRNYLMNNLIAYMKNKYHHLKSRGLTDEADKIEQLGDLSKIHSFWEYDDRVVARLHHFKDVHDYYRQSSSRQFLKNIRIPTIIIQSLDDPFMTEKLLPKAGDLSAHVQLELQSHGGHLGFISGNNPLKANYWLEQRIVAVLQQQGW